MGYTGAVEILVAALAVTLGVVAGTSFARRRAAAHSALARQEAEGLVASARVAAKALAEEATGRVRRDFAALCATTQAALEGYRAELAEHEADLCERERLVEGREQSAVELDAHCDTALASCRTLEVESERLSRAAAGKDSERLVALETKSGTVRDELREQLVREQVGKIELSALMRLREREAATEVAAPLESRRVMQLAIERYDGASHLERTHNSIPIEQREMFALLADATGACHVAFVAESGCELVCDEPSRSATVRGDDPLARELARRVVRQLASLHECDADRVRQLMQQTRTEIDREVVTAARRACRQLDIGRVHPDLQNLVGRLKYRLSYSQNQLKHSIEVAYLAGLMAEELGLDRQAARRGGLLHDIGKAMTHDHDGSHALLGADVARRCGEDDAIVNAIAAHHNDEPARTALANLVAAADALSGARPGARRESVTQYLHRIAELQRIASRSPAVHRVDIMQAGRDVRVIVAGEERGCVEGGERHNGPLLADSDLGPLAQEIARGIERDLTFAGQIRVTVIRESRAVAIAR